MSEPQILLQDPRGFNNANGVTTLERLENARSYQDLSTICVIPTRGTIHAKIVQQWWMLLTPMNQKFVRMFAMGLEVADAYNQMVGAILDHNILREFRYLLTLEEDNLPPVDGLLKLYEGIGEFDVVGGLYWTKGEAGQPMIYGDPSVEPVNFIPQLPSTEGLQPACGLGMGFNLFKLDIFKDERLERPWFRTQQEEVPGEGLKCMTQDLYFYERAGALGYKFACDTRIKVGHMDIDTEVIW